MYDKVSSESPETGFIVAGDFNPCSNGFDMKCLSDYCDYNLKQVVKDPTRNSNILDLIFTNMGSHYNPPEVIAPLSTSDHNMVIWMAKTQQRFVNIVKKIKFRPTPRYNLQQFGSCLAQYDWSTVLNVENVDEKVEDFTRATNDMINYYFPERTVRMHSDDKFFITTKIKRLLRKRDNAYKQGRMQKFRELRNRVASEIRKAKWHYYVMNIGRLNTNGDARMWWKKVWKLIGKKKSSINLSEQGSDSKLEDKDAANMINTFFADLTNDFPEIKSRWSSYGHSDVLPTFGNELSTSCIINGGVPQSSRIGPIAFVVHINGLKAVIKDTDSSLINSSNDDNDDDCDDDLTLFVDDTTLSEVINYYYY